MKGKIINFSKWNAQNQRTGIEIEVNGNGKAWFSHYGTTDKLRPFKKGELIEFTAEKDKITSIKKIIQEPIKKEYPTTPKATTETIFSNETSIIQLTHNIVNHFTAKNEGTKTLKKELFFKVYEQLKLDERTRLIQGFKENNMKAFR